MMLTSPLPDETLYGLVARSGRMRGDTLGNMTSRSLFDHPDAGLHHDFPNHLERLSVNTHGCLGSVPTIITQLTAAPYFLRFKPSSTSIWMEETMAGVGTARLKHLLGLPASLCRARQPLRACPQCIAEDQAEHGIASWRRAHQLPGTLYCGVHAAPLLSSSLRIGPRGKSRYLLPEDTRIFECNPPLHDETQAACLTRLAKLDACLLHHTLPAPYSRERMALAYRHGLKAHGLLTPGGLVRAQSYLNWLQSTFHSIQSVDPFRHALSGAHQATLLRMVRKPRTDFHPLYHLLLIDALFGGWEAFVTVYAWEAGMDPTPDLPEYPGEIAAVPAEISAFVADLKQPGQVSAINRLAKQHDLDIGTAMRWAGKLGVGIRRRPKVLHHDLKAEVVAALISGEPQRDIAKRTGLSRATIDRVCQEQPGRYTAWQAANREWKGKHARTAFLAYLQDHPSATVADARRDAPPGYCWLRRHDAQWLRAVLPDKKRSASSRAQPRRSYVDWAERDATCFSHLCQLAATITFEPWERLKPGTVLRKLPTLSFLPRLEQLPKSRALIDEILKEHVAHRRSRGK